jgi:hypothetical protein
VNLSHLARVLRAVEPFMLKGKDVAVDDQKGRVAISFSRVRATNGHSAIHVWETESGNLDVGPIAQVSRRDAVMVIARAENLLEDIENEEDAPVAWSFDDRGFNVEEKTLPLLDGITIEDLPWLPTDKIFEGQWASHVDGRDRFMDPRRVAIFSRAAAALGITKLQYLLGKAQDTGMFVYGKSGALSMMAISMPLNDVEPDIRDVMTRRHP